MNGQLERSWNYQSLFITVPNYSHRHQASLIHCRTKAFPSAPSLRHRLLFCVLCPTPAIVVISYFLWLSVCVSTSTIPGLPLCYFSCPSVISSRHVACSSPLYLVMCYQFSTSKSTVYLLVHFVLLWLFIFSQSSVSCDQLSQCCCFASLRSVEPYIFHSTFSPFAPSVSSVLPVLYKSWVLCCDQLSQCCCFASLRYVEPYIFHSTLSPFAPSLSSVLPVLYNSWVSVSTLLVIWLSFP